MNWSYCIIRKTHRRGKKTHHYYDVHEIYRYKNGKIRLWTKDPVSVNGSDDINGLRWALAMMIADSYRQSIYEIKKNKLVVRTEQS